MRLVLIRMLILRCIKWINGQNEKFSIDIKQNNSEVYHEQSSDNNEFFYGYYVGNQNTQFQHKVKGPDDVTYGCYGYIDLSNQKHLYYYVADRKGYRLITPGQPTKVFTNRVTNSINKLNDDLDRKVVAWNDLYLPESCHKLEEIVTVALQSSTAIYTKSTVTTTTPNPTLTPIFPAPAVPEPTVPPSFVPPLIPNGYVYPLNVTCLASEVSLALLMIQMDLLNEKVIELGLKIRNLQGGSSMASSCQSWLIGQDQVPLILYVPILVPFVNAEEGLSRSFSNPASYAFQKMCCAHGRK